MSSSRLKGLTCVSIFQSPQAASDSNQQILNQVLGVGLKFGLNFLMGAAKEKLLPFAEELNQKDPHGFRRLSQFGLDTFEKIKDQYGNEQGIGGVRSTGVVEVGMVHTGESLDPYSISAHLGQSLADGKNWVELSKEEEKQFAFVMEDLGHIDINAVNSWVKSPAHAAYLYHYLHLVRDHREVRQFILNEMIEKNYFFKETSPILADPFQFLTYSFEKETRKKKYLDWYKKVGMTDDEWSLVPEDQRAEALAQNVFHEKGILSARIVEPTQSKPVFLDGFSVELSGDLNASIDRGLNKKNKKPTYEAIQRSFVISRKTLKESIHEIAWHLEEESGFHVNIGMDLPEDYEHFEQFGMWLKQLEDFVFLNGLRDQFYGTDKIRLPDPPIEVFSRGMVEGLQTIMEGSDYLPLKLSEVIGKSHKYFHIALRTGEKYGSPPRGYKRVVIEMRDVASTLEDLDRMIDRVSIALSTRVWERNPEQTWHAAKGSKIWLLRSEAKVFLHEFSEVCEDSVILSKVMDLVLKAEPHALIPMETFEFLNLFDYRTGQNKTFSRDQSFQLMNARNWYKKEFFHYLVELASSVKAQDSSKLEKIPSEIRTLMSRWEKKSNLSLIYDETL